MPNQKKYFHDIYFRKILKLSEEYRLNEAIYEFQKYLRNYPNDLNGYVYYADTLIKANDIERAEEILNVARNLITDKTSELAIEEYVQRVIKLLIQQKKYQECYRIFSEVIQVFYKKDWEADRPYLFLRKKLNMMNYKDKSQENYFLRQIVSYNESEALEHIRKHQNLENGNTLQFSDNFSLETIYYKIREMLPMDIKRNKGFIANSYIFKYDSNGHIDNKLVDFFMVIALQDSNDIITMYPYENREKAGFFDLNPDLEPEESPKLKRVSQIDKFNQRYAKNKK